MHSIRGRIIAITTAAVMASILAFLAIAYVTVNTEANRHTTEVMNMVAGNVQQSLDEYLASIRQSVEMAAHFATDSLDPVVLVECGVAGSGAGQARTRTQVKKLDVYLAQHAAEVLEAFASIANHTSGVVSYYYCFAPEISENEHGFFYSKVGQTGFAELEPPDASALDPADMEHNTWYFTPIRRGRPSWVGPYTDRFQGDRQVVSYLAPVYKANTLIGVLGMDILFETMEEKVEDVRISESGYACLLDESGTFLVHPELAYGTKADGVLLAQLKNRTDSGGSVVYFMAGGEERELAFKTLSSGMKVAVVAPTREVSAAWDTMMQRILIAALGLLVLAGVGSALAVRRLIRPLGQLTEAAKRISGGDYEVGLNYDADNEVGQLTRAFREMQDNLRLHISDLNSKAYTDALTRVRNKAAFNIQAERLNRTLRQQREGEPEEFAIAMFDLNDLKVINDECGHDRGDRYLQKACRTICRVYAHCPVFRLGGDEFAALLRNEDYDNREALLEEFDRAVQENNRNEEKPWEKISVARGMATYRAGTDANVEDVLRRADQRMYRDKRRQKEGEIR